MNRQTRPRNAPVHVDPGVSRPAAILRVAEDLERRGAKVLDLFEKVESPRGEATLPIYYFDGEECFAEVEAGPWDAAATDRVLMAAAVLRGSERAGARMDLFGAHPVPENLRFFASRAPAALLQVDLFYPEDTSPEALAEHFKVAASSRWGVDLDYDPGCLPLTEHLLLAVLDDDGLLGRTVPVSEPLIRGVGCYVGELARRKAESSGVPGGWRRESGRDEHLLQLGGIILDPIVKAGDFLRRGEEVSIARYVSRALEVLDSEA